MRAVYFVDNIIDILQRQAPERYACDWDNVGLLVGERDEEVHTIYIALDATDEAIDEAIESGADFLLTHHPMVFKGVKRITSDDFVGRRIIRLIQHGISYYAMHTNFDVKGMADLAAERLGLTHTVPLEVTCEEEDGPQGIGRIGYLPGVYTLKECAGLVKEAFGIPSVRVFGEMARHVEKVAICPGSGKSTLPEALQSEADLYITGDIDHHTGIDAYARGLAVIDAGHYGIEKIFVPYMEQYLKEQAPELKIVTQYPVEPFVTV